MSSDIEVICCIKKMDCPIPLVKSYYISDSSSSSGNLERSRYLNSKGRWLHYCEWYKTLSDACDAIYKFEQWYEEDNIGTNILDNIVESC